MNPWNRENLNSATPWQMTTLLWVQANTRRQLEDATEQANKNHATEYNTQWEQWKKNRDDRPSSNLNEPMPAKAQEVIVGESGWPSAVDTAQFVTLPRLYIAPVLTPKVSIFGIAGGVPVSQPDPLAGIPLYGRYFSPNNSVWMRIA